MIRHASLIAARLGGRWRGVLLEGPSGSGKSDLALRAAYNGFHLVADDRVVVFVSGRRLFGRAPETIAGLVEARGVGVVSTAILPLAQIVLLVHCTAREAVERHPDPETVSILGVDVPALNLWPFGASAPMKLILALEYLGLAT